VRQILNIPGGVDGGPSGGNTGGNTGGTLQTYTVVAGDTLSKIARQFNTTVQAIAQQNNIANVNLILIGQQLQIPGTTGGGTGSPVQPPPSPAPSGNFELGGHMAHAGDFDDMTNAGMTWAKVQIRYHPGDNADITAPHINAAHLAGFRILLSIVGEVNDLAAADYNTYTDEFAAFLGGVAQLGPEAIEVWNEQNLDREWPNGRIDPVAYTTMLQKAHTAIKAVNQNILVISGAPAPTGAESAFGSAAVWNDNRYIAGMAQAGAANYMDCIGAHYNEGIIGPNQRSGDPRGNGAYYTRYFFGMLDTYTSAFNNTRPVCWTELGYISPEGFPGGVAPAGFEWANDTSVAEHAQWLGEAASLSRSSGRVRLMIVWNVNFQDAAPDPSGMYAIIRPDGTCPACANLAAAVQ
jgi:hypothetical protein